MVQRLLRWDIQRLMKREIHTALRNGMPVLLRPIRRADRPQLVEGIDSLSERSRYLRFFSAARRLPSHVIDRLADVDAKNHIAWGGIDKSHGRQRVIGAVHAMRADDDHSAELAFGILDDVHSQGLARMLIAAVVHDCQKSGIRTLRADTLSENQSAARLLRHIGGYCCEAEAGLYSFKLDVADCERRMRQLSAPNGLQTVYAALDAEDARKAA